MSRYLIDQIERTPRIIITPCTNVTALLGEERLECLDLLDSAGRRTSTAARGLFVFIGAEPSTGWLDGQLAQDRHGFLLTGTGIPDAELDDPDRLPLFLQTRRCG